MVSYRNAFIVFQGFLAGGGGEAVKMAGWAGFAVVFVLAVHLAAPLPGRAQELPSSVANELQALNTELGQAQAASQALFAEQAALQNEEKRLIATRELLDGAKKNFLNEVQAWRGELQAHNADAASQRAAAAQHGAKVQSHNARCTGTFSDQGYVNACNAAAAQLNSYNQSTLDPWRRRVNANAQRVDSRRDTLAMKEKGLNERYADLQRGVLDWTKRKKENNYKLNELQARQDALRQRIQAVLNSPAVRDLVRRKQASAECAGLAEGAGFEARLDGRLERAHRCLQRVWDGAR